MPVDLSALCLNFLLTINQQGFYPIVETCPKIEVVSLVELQKRACDGAKCPVEAFYDLQEKSIYLSDELDMERIFYRSVLLHELVHYVQDITGNWEEHENHCRAGIMRELNAFRVQERYLLDNNVHIPVSQNITYYRC